MEKSYCATNRAKSKGEVALNYRIFVTNERGLQDNRENNQKER